MPLPTLITNDSATSRDHRRSRTESRYAFQPGYSVRLQGCNWFKCAGVAISCAAVCVSGIGTAACIACLGGAYGECKDCF